MSQKASPTAVGLFIVVGIALGIIGLILFSSGALFSKRDKFILYFNASLKGLNPGAAVKMRGVTIGSVVEVLIHHNQATNDYAMPVIIEIDEKRATTKTDRLIDPASKGWVDQRVGLGLRGKLDAESLVTGVLYVELGIYTNAAPPVFHQIQPEYIEIPTAPTEIQELLANLAHLDLRGISDKLNALLARLDTSLADLDVKQINAGVTNFLASANRVVGSPDVTNSLAELKLLLADTRALVKRLDSRVDPLADSATNALDEVQKTLADLRLGIQNVSNMVQPDAPLNTDLTMALSQLSDAARAVADLAEFLQRNPNSLITGRKLLHPQP